MASFYGNEKIPEFARGMVSGAGATGAAFSRLGDKLERMDAQNKKAKLALEDKKTKVDLLKKFYPNETKGLDDDQIFTLRGHLNDIKSNNNKKEQHQNKLKEKELKALEAQQDKANKVSLFKKFYPNETKGLNDDQIFAFGENINSFFKGKSKSRSGGGRGSSSPKKWEIEAENGKRFEENRLKGANGIQYDNALEAIKSFKDKRRNNRLAKLKI